MLVRRGLSRRAEMGEASSAGSTRLIARADANAKRCSHDWVDEARWVEFLAADAETRSNTSVCLKIVDPRFTALQRRAGGIREDRAPAREGGRRAATSPATATRRRACASGAAPPSSAPTSRRSRPGSTGPMRKRRMRRRRHAMLMTARVLVSDQLSRNRGCRSSSDRGVDADYEPELGADKDGPARRDHRRV